MSEYVDPVVPHKIWLNAIYNPIINADGDVESFILENNIAQGLAKCVYPNGDVLEYRLVLARGTGGDHGVPPGVGPAAAC